MSESKKKMISIEYKSVSDLKGYKNNSRTHSPEQVGQIAFSIQEFGFTNPILLDESGTIIAGHGRLMAATEIGMEEVPTITLDGLTDSQIKALVIADNKLALNAGWDMGLLKIEIEELKQEEFNIDILGFDDTELSEIMGIEDSIETEEDEAPEPQEDPVSKEGDIWTLGEHRLMCGDSTDAGTVFMLMDGNKADMVFTDPPYNTGMTAQTQSGQGGTHWKGNKKKGETARLSHMFDDSYTDEEWEKFMADFCARYDESVKDDSFLFVCLDWRRSHELVPHLKSFWKFSNLIIWDKMVHGLGSDYKYTHEFIHVCKKGKPPLATNKAGEKEYQDVWRIQRKMGRDEEHATKKPIELCTRAVQHASRKDDIVLDLFGGSGSTLIGCEQTGRKCYMMELDPKYVDVIIKRWENLTGKDATLDGKTYKELSNG
jgi:DNA modification methylase